ncbi:MAG: hypothetical protein BWK78_00605 [Thiotrichaceae bacterium IS1]|nr:MAG: hypothetical protein BWK78_00605 [Thiotrichaceae bacterium IS1]
MNDKKSNQVYIRFENVTPEEAGKLASELKDRLQKASNQIPVEPHKPDPRSMDVGTELIMGIFEHFPAALAAHVFISFFQEKGARVTIVMEDNLRKLVCRIDSASKAVEENVKKSLLQWFDKPAAPPKPEGNNDGEDNKPIK